MGYRKEMFDNAGGKALAQVAQRSCGHPLAVFKARLDRALSTLV